MNGSYLHQNALKNRLDTLYTVTKKLNSKYSNIKISVSSPFIFCSENPEVKQVSFLIIINFTVFQ